MVRFSVLLMTASLIISLHMQFLIYGKANLDRAFSLNINNESVCWMSSPLL